MQAMAERAEVQQEAIKSELAADISHAARMEKAKEEISQKAQAAQKAVEETAAQSEKVLADKAEEIVAEAGILINEETAKADADASGDAEGVEAEAAPEQESADRTPEEPAAEESAEEEAAAEEPAAAEEAAAEEPAVEEAEEEPEVQEEEVPEEPQEEVSPEQMQEDMVRSMREIVSGVGPRSAMDEEEAALDQAIEQSKEDQENAVAARGADRTFSVPQSAASQKRTAGKLTIDDILLSMGDRGERVREVTGGNVLSGFGRGRSGHRRSEGAGFPEGRSEGSKADGGDPGQRDRPRPGRSRRGGSPSGSGKRRTFGRGSASDNGCGRGREAGGCSGTGQLPEGSPRGIYGRDRDSQDQEASGRRDPQAA